MSPETMPADFGKLLIFFGAVLLILGLILTFLPAVTSLRIGRLPGDFFFKGGRWTFYFPLATSLLISLLLTLILWLVAGLRK